MRSAIILFFTFFSSMLLAGELQVYIINDGVYRGPIGERGIFTFHPIEHVIGVSKDGKLAASSNQNLIFIWNLESNKLVSQIIESRFGPIYSVTFFGESNRYIAYQVSVADGFNSLTVIEISTGKIVLQETIADRFSLGISPSGRYLSVLGYRRIIFYDSKNFNTRLRTEKNYPGKMVFSSDEKMIAHSSRNGHKSQLGIYSFPDLRLIRALSGGIRPLAFLENGKTIAIQDNNKLRYVDLVSGNDKVIMTHSSQRNLFRSVGAKSQFQTAGRQFETVWVQFSNVFIDELSGELVAQGSNGEGTLKWDHQNNRFINFCGSECDQSRLAVISKQGKVYILRDQPAFVDLRSGKVANIEVVVVKLPSAPTVLTYCAKGTKNDTDRSECLQACSIYASRACVYLDQYNLTEDEVRKLCMDNLAACPHLLWITKSKFSNETKFFIEERACNAKASWGCTEALKLAIKERKKEKFQPLLKSLCLTNDFKGCRELSKEVSHEVAPVDSREFKIDTKELKICKSPQTAEEDLFGKYQESIYFEKEKFEGWRIEALYEPGLIALSEGDIIENTTGAPCCNLNLPDIRRMCKDKHPISILNLEKKTRTIYKGIEQ